MSENQLTTDDEKLRGSIATRVLMYGTLTLCIVSAIIILAGMIIFLKNQSDKDSVNKGTELIIDVFHALLPVIATWVGTVIAFYFGKANFEAASKSVQDMVKQFTNSDQKLQATKVTDKGIMRDFSDIIYNTKITSKKDETINVKTDILDFMDINLSEKGQRLPIFDDTKVVRYILHESLINEFARKLSTNTFPVLKDRKIEDITLAELINSTTIEIKNKITNSATFVRKDSTLYDVNQKLINNPNSQDAFVTETGEANEPIIGWITNNKIAEFAKL